MVELKHDKSAGPTRIGEAMSHDLPSPLMLPVNTRVILKSFNGTDSAPDCCRQDENYWALIGKSGRIVEPLNGRGRVLVCFDTSVVQLGLPCHNPVLNSLYIQPSDLEVLP
ncbi:MAG: hypothetical protein LBE81_11040 [Azonexus sp.]|jgi:hypothetical protein|uniref:hypothetical protein n=1 Tax=Azonexus sp. TaxID=1872668 RepID=UPI0028298D5F|nr:hypothetical protein [Azonexus sp.]MDR0777154.1 hypothetical protein [Azonexus sp.]